MLKTFGGMIMGSIMTMMLLGGASASDHILANAQQIYLQHISRPDAVTSLLLLVMIGVFLSLLSAWPTRQANDSQKIISYLRRHCS